MMAVPVPFPGEATESMPQFEGITTDLIWEALYFVFITAGLWKYIVGAFIIGILLRLLSKALIKKRPSKPMAKQDTKLVKGVSYYKKPFLLTKRELVFYSDLLPIAQQKGLYLFSKVRMADLVNPVKETPNWYNAFSKIAQKHCDFVLCDKHSRPLLLIELDDNSHYKQNRDDRDIFVDKAYESAGIPILHTLSSTGLSQKIDEYLKKSPSKV